MTILVVAATAACGCGAGDKPRTAPVVGTVTLNGEALVGAIVTFWPTEGKTNPSAGVTDKSGGYRLRGAYDGATPGKYKVTIEYYTKPNGSPAETSEGMDMQQLVAQGQARQALPESYSDLSGTALTAEVNAGSTNTIDFKLNRDGT